MDNTQYVVTAYKAKRQIKNAGLHIFGPFVTEEAAQEFADAVQISPDWQLEEIPVLNDPYTLTNGEARLL